MANTTIHTKSNNRVEDLIRSTVALDFNYNYGSQIYRVRPNLRFRVRLATDPIIDTVSIQLKKEIND